MARPLGSPNKDKPFREALRMEIAAAADDRLGLRSVARALIAKAVDGDVGAIKELGDRLDGKVPQAVIGGDADQPTIKLEQIERVIIQASHTNGRDISASTEPSEI